MREGEEGQEGKGGCGDEIRRGRDDSPKDGGSFGNVMAVYPLESYCTTLAEFLREVATRPRYRLTDNHGAREYYYRGYKPASAEASPRP